MRRQKEHYSPKERQRLAKQRRRRNKKIPPYPLKQKSTVPQEYEEINQVISEFITDYLTAIAPTIGIAKTNTTTIPTIIITKNKTRRCIVYEPQYKSDTIKISIEYSAKLAYNSIFKQTTIISRCLGDPLLFSAIEKELNTIAFYMMGIDKKETDEMAAIDLHNTLKSSLTGVQINKVGNNAYHISRMHTNKQIMIALYQDGCIKIKSKVFRGVLKLYDLKSYKNAIIKIDQYIKEIFGQDNGINTRSHF